MFIAPTAQNPFISWLIASSAIATWNPWPASIDEIRQRGDINDTQKRKILADNAKRLYKLK